MQHIAPEAKEEVLSTLNRDGTRKYVRPKLSTGRFLTRRRIVAYGLMALFVALPYFEIHGKPLILLDLSAREFTFFGTTFLATDTLFLMLLGLVIVFAVLLLTAMYGRVWCGWACPQTVYMEFLFRPIERLFEGSPAQQRKLDRQGWNVRRLLKNVTFLILSMFVAHVFLAYFVGVDRLGQWVQRSPFAHPTSFLIMASVSVLMFADFAWFREQTCIVACPYGRLQAVLLDRQSLIVGYDAARGEPRGKPKAASTGDCIDCRACVNVCPTGIDIRRGLQMECISCAQCIDACDAIMLRIKKPIGLVRYSTQDELEGAPRKLLRPRVLIYPAMVLLALGALVVTLGSRPAADVTILRAAGTPFTLLPQNEVSNQVRVKVVNRTRANHRYTIELVAPKDARLIAPRPSVTLGPNEATTFMVFIISKRSHYKNGRRSIRLRVSAADGYERLLDHTVLGPGGL